MVDGDVGLRQKAVAALYFYQPELQALPPSIAAELEQIAAGKAGAPEWSSLAAAVERYRDRSLRRMQHWLRVLGPETAMDMVSLKRAITGSAVSSYLLISGFNRFSWMLAVGASGEDRSLTSLRSYVTSCAQWMAAHELAAVMTNRDADLAMGIKLNPPREVTRRMSPVFVHFRWASELICRSFAEEVASNVGKYAGLEIVTVRAVSDLFSWVEEYISTQEQVMGGRSMAARLPTPPPRASALLDGLALAAGSLGKQPVHALVSSLDMEFYPFVKFGDSIVPVAYREASYILELAFFSLARRRLKHEKDRSDLYEEVVRRALRKVLPPDVELPSGNVFCPASDSSDSGETDFIMRSSTSTFIGECKAMTAVPAPGRVINTFTDHVGKAATQLAVRMSAVERGNPPIVGGASWLAPTGKVFGIAVPLHAYGGAVWNHECLPEVEADRPCLAVVPVHQLLLAVRALTSGDDLGAYIEFRQQLLAAHVEIFDELDILASYIGGGHTPSDGVQILTPFSVDVRGSIVREVPASPPVWRRQLRKNLRRVG